MRQPKVIAVGTEAETAHHIREVSRHLPIEIMEPDEAERVSQAGDLAIFYSEHFDRFRNCCVELKKKRVGTLYMIDGILEWRNAWENRPTEPACPWTMRTALSHKIACIGAGQKRVLDFWGNQGKTEIVGVPRFEFLRRKFVAQPDSEKYRRCNDSQSAPFRILVATAKTPGFTERQIATTLRSLIDLKHQVEILNQSSERPCELIWRINPELAAQIQVSTNLSETTGLELAAQLELVDAVITSPSTIMLEAMLLRRPLAILDFHRTPSLTPAAWTITNAADIPNVVAELQNPAAAKLELQEMLLQDALACDQDAGILMAQLIERMQADMRESLASDQPVAFGENLLPGPGKIGRMAPLNRLFPQFPELGFDSVEQLAAEWAQSRREIKHLQRELSQAKSELREAHAIFEQIHSHPIAGPIVRIRQKWRSIWGWDSSPAGVAPEPQTKPQSINQ